MTTGAQALDNHIKPADLTILAFDEPECFGALTVCQQERTGEAPVLKLQVHRLHVALVPHSVRHVPGQALLQLFGELACQQGVHLILPASHHTLWAIFWDSVREKGWPSIRPACNLSPQTRANSRRPPTSDGVLVAEFAEKTVSNHGNRV